MMPQNILPSPVLMQSLLQQQLPQFTSVEWREQITSTNVFLMQQAKEGVRENARPALLGAHYQSSGKGRLGRKWSGESGSSLMFSCAYNVDMELKRIPMLAPLAGIIACEQLSQSLGAQRLNPLRMKWPNDIQYGDAKLSGLLVESVRPGGVRKSDNHYVVVVGMGMNLLHAKQLSQTLGRKVADWTSVLHDMHIDEQQVSQSLAALVASIADAWQQAFSLYQAQGFGVFLERHHRIDALYNQPIEVWQDNKLIHTGIAKGLDEQAHLRLQTADGRVIPLLTGDITVRASDE